MVSRHTRVGICLVYSPSSASCTIHGQILEIHTTLAAHYFERRCSGQFSPIGNGVDSGRQSRTTDSFDASDTHAYWLSTIRERDTFRGTLNGIVEALRDRPSHQVIRPSAVKLFLQSEPLAISRTKGRTEVHEGEVFVGAQGVLFSGAD